MKSQIAGILDKVKESCAEIIQTSETQTPVTEDKVPQSVHFPELTNQDLDDLGLKYRFVQKIKLYKNT